MLVKVQIQPQKKQIEWLNEVIFTAEVRSSTENSVQTEWSLETKGLGFVDHSSKFLQFSSLILVKKEDTFTLKVECEIDGVRIREILDVESAEEVANFPAIYKKMSKVGLPNINFIVKHKKLIARLLEKAGDQFANHVCNDFDVTDYLPDREHQHELAKVVFDKDDPERYNPSHNYETMNDSELMLFFANRIRSL
jgi:hypothetical protein